MAVATLPDPGEVLAGKYRIVRLIGRGAMGAVFHAEDILLERDVALKLLLDPTVAQEGETRTRFLNEARAAARIESEHIARVHDVALLSDGRPLLVMEYLDGMDLQAILENEKKLPVGEAALWLAQACEALSQAHAKGIIHRDLKPANLFIARRGDGTKLLKILDFGISKVSRPHHEVSITAPQIVLGTPLYMAPEQARHSKALDARADLWSLGTILYELVSGVSPFAWPSLGEIFTAIIKAEYTPLGEIVPNVPPGIAAVVDRCLRRDPAKRYASARELKIALAPFVRYDAPTAPLQTSARSAVRSPDLAMAAPAKGDETPFATLVEVPSLAPKPRRKALLVSVAGALLAGGAAGLFLAVHGVAPKHSPAIAAVPPELASASAAPPPSAPVSSAEAAQVPPGLPPSVPVVLHAPGASVGRAAPASGIPRQVVKPAPPPSASPPPPENRHVMPL